MYLIGKLLPHSCQSAKEIVNSQTFLYSMWIIVISSTFRRQILYRHLRQYHNKNNTKCLIQFIITRNSQGIWSTSHENVNFKTQTLTDNLNRPDTKNLLEALKLPAVRLSIHSARVNKTMDMTEERFKFPIHTHEQWQPTFPPSPKYHPAKNMIKSCTILYIFILESAPQVQRGISLALDYGWIKIALDNG